VIALVENNPRALQSNSAAVSRRLSDGNVPLNGQRIARKPKPRPTIEELREYLDYEPQTGVLRWKKSCGCVKAGAIAGSTQGNGYSAIRINKVKVLAHRAAFALHHGRWPHPCCDHIDGDVLNNRADNLRECSLSNNQHNSRLRKDNSTGVKGVGKNGGGYLARVGLNGRAYTKRFRHLEDAAAWVKQAREQLHGEFARH
jgi:hypothetical protein